MGTRLEGVQIGDESDSGKAVRVKIDGKWEWVPLSAVDEMHRDPRNKDSDVIVIADWLCQKNGWGE